MLSVAELNNLSDADFASTLKQCSSSAKWLSLMAKRRPYASLQDLLVKAKEAWLTLDTRDYLEVIASHPRIGAKKSEQSGFSKQEQASLALTDDLTASLLRFNDIYYEKFGFIFLIFATGKSASEILTHLQARLPNSREQEIGNAAQELLLIQDLRLRKLIS